MTVLAMHKTCLAAFRWGWIRSSSMCKQGTQVHSHCRKKEEKTVIDVRVLRYSRGGPKGLLVQLEGLQTLTVIKEVVSSLVDAQSCVICIHIIYWHINTTAKILNIWQYQIKK